MAEGGIGHGGDGIKEQDLPLSATAAAADEVVNDTQAALKDQKSGEMAYDRQHSLHPPPHLDPMGVVDDHSDPNQSIWPTSIGDVKPNQRLKAINMYGQWHSGTVIHIVKGPEYHQVRFHFDYSPNSYDVWLTEKDWKCNKVAPLYSKMKKRSHSYRIIVVNRAIGSGMAAQQSQRSGSMQQQQHHYQSPLCGSDGGGHKDPLMGGSRSSNPAATNNPSQISSEVSIHGTPLLLYCDSRASTRHFWRLVVRRVAPYISDPVLSAEALSVADCEDDLSLLQKLPFTIRILPSNQCCVENAGIVLRPDIPTSAASVLYCDSLVTIDWLDYYRAYQDPLEDMIRLPFHEKEEYGVVQPGIPLYSCLETFTNEESVEVNEDDGYYCKKCETKRAVSTKMDLWKVPDILVIHVKRFYHTMQCREKIRSLVVFPLSGLDVSSFVAESSPQRKNSGVGGLMYDLYSVLNHMGDMSGGHYTA